MWRVSGGAKPLLKTRMATIQYNNKHATRKQAHTDVLIAGKLISFAVYWIAKPSNVWVTADENRVLKIMNTE